MPEKPLSLEHWIDSLNTVLLVASAIELAGTAGAGNAGASAKPVTPNSGINAELDITINPAKQGKHIIGHNNYMEGRSVFYGSINEAQKLVNNFTGTGTRIGTNKERINFNQVIGQYVDPTTGVAVDTSVGIIHYSKSGTHIVPAKPQQ